MFAEVSKDVEKCCSQFIEDMAELIEISVLRTFTNNHRQPKFNFHWLKEISSFEVIGELTLDLRE